MRTASRSLLSLVVLVVLSASCRCSSQSQEDKTATDASNATETMTPPAIDVRLTTPSGDGMTRGASRSFVSTDRLVFRTDGAETQWSGGEALDPDGSSGPLYEVRLRTKKVSIARSAPLKVSVLVTEGERRTTFVIEQDAIDTIRQQYIDLAKKRTPRRSEFLSGGRSRRGYFRFSEIQSRDRAPWAVFTALDHLDQWRENYGGPLKVNRGYTTPKHNAKIAGAAKNSQHLFGTAADIDSAQADWIDKRDAARDAGACTEPLTICGYAHVHGDWRSECPAGW
jgi:peptidase M15-like protein